MDDLGVTVHDYLDVIRRRKVPFLLVLVLFPVIVYFSTESDAPRFRSSVRVKIEDPPAHQPLFKEIGGSFQGESSLATQIEIIRSESLAAELVRALKQEQYQEAKLRGAASVWPELDDERRARRLLVRDIEAEAVPGTKIIQIKVTADSEEKAKRLVNTLADVYVDYSVRRKRERMAGTLEFINEQLEKLRQERIDEEKALWAYKSNTRFETVDTGMQRLSSLENLYVNTVIERQIDETRLEEIKRLLSEQKRQVLPEISHYTSPLVERFRDKLSELEYERALLLREFTPEHQEVKDLTYEIEQTQQVLAEEVKGLMDADLPSLDPLATYKNLLNEMIDLQLSISTQKRREAVLAKTVDHYVNQLENLADKEIEVSRLKYKIEVKKNTYERFLQKKEQVELSIAMETGDVQVLDYAFSALNLTGHQKATTMAWSVVAALLGATGIAFFLDMNDKRIKNESEVKKILGLPLMGMVPKIRLPRRGGLVETVAHYEEGTPYAESFRKLRTQIEFKSIDTPLKTILCTSTRQEEGKTTVITNLGISFAQKGERVLIVDCDLRRPALHKNFATRRSPGLSDILVEDTAWQQVVQETEIPNLYILTSGERPRNPSELLGSARMKTLIQQFSAQFDRVLFDISSVLAVTDSAVLGPICDGVILTVKAMEVPRDYILQAIEMLNSVGSNMLGVALNGVKISRRSYYYYYYSEEALAGGNSTAAAQPS